MDSLKDLLDRGLVPMTRMRSLQRDAAQLTGICRRIWRRRSPEPSSRSARPSCRSSTSTASASPTTARTIATPTCSFRRPGPSWSRLRQQIDRRPCARRRPAGWLASASSPSAAWFRAGQKLMDIVPEDEPLVIEAGCEPNDADDLKIGQSTEIRIPAFPRSSPAAATGEVQQDFRRRADRRKDRRQPTSSVEVAVPPSQLAIIRQFRGADAGLKAWSAGRGGGAASQADRLRLPRSIRSERCSGSRSASREGSGADAGALHRAGQRQRIGKPAHVEPLR